MDEVKEIQIEEVKEDIWWISGEYLAAAYKMVAWQFIDDEEVEYATREEFAERVEYVFRQHCPIAYSHFYVDLPYDAQMSGGVLEILLSIIQSERKEPSWEMLYIE
jgi:hypothetical protein